MKLIAEQLNDFPMECQWLGHEVLDTFGPITGRLF